MICERAYKTHIRQLGRTADDFTFVLGVKVRLTRTPCHLGGQRLWFLCPNCGRRCAILYPLFCRLCANGRYLSERLSVRSRRIRRAIELRERLGQTEGGTIAPFPKKPKRMRWRTYYRLWDKSHALEAVMWEAEWAMLKRWRR
ncbi:MAG: hypothetical protein KF887_12425 [Paracoccaceae bacterium]|nr:MAG: hypothetical protein KF887_12425 [Paracoccaceae bacterium]